MNYKVKMGTKGGVITLTDKHYKTAGGEAAIYVSGSTAFKIFHDPKKAMIPAKKIEELARIGNRHIVIPQETIYDATTGEPLGFTSHFVADVFPLARFFTRTFKDENNISPKMINDLVKQNQIILADVHAANCLIVDFNELNVLVKIDKGLEPWFIDTNSYATPSFRATAIMDSVRDRRVSVMQNGSLYYNADALSDWFSWGILSFWLYTNIHPFRGSHPDYKPKDKAKQMDDGISVFHKGVRVPPSVNDFSVIPKRHLDWFKAVFLKNERNAPPLPDSSVPLAVPAAIITVTSTDRVKVTQTHAFPDSVLSTFYLMGTLYAVTKNLICFGKREVTHLMKAKKVLLCASPDGVLVAAYLVGSKVHFLSVHEQTEIGTIASNGVFARNGAIYTVANGKMVENTFTKMGQRLIHRTAEIENISMLTATVYDDCIVQDLLGKKYLTLPYAKGRSFSKYIPQLDKFRIIDARSDKNVTVILAERAGVYHRFIIVFDANFRDFQMREVKDVAYDAINFTVSGGLCLLLASPTELELFTDPKTIETLNDPPFDSTMRLFSTPDGVFFTNGNTIHQINSK